MAKKKVINNSNIVKDGTVTYSFKEVFIDENGEQHFVTPRSDPHMYEDDFGYIFGSIEQAGEFLQNEIENENVTQDEVQNWFLVKNVQTTVVDMPLKFKES